MRPKTGYDATTLVEREVLRLSALGHTVPEISTLRGVAYSTTRAQLESIRLKCLAASDDCKGRLGTVRLVALALKHALVTQDDLVSLLAEGT